MRNSRLPLLKMLAVNAGANNVGFRIEIVLADGTPVLPIGD
jgi:hypothetical protein